MELSEQINSRVEEVVEAVKKASENNAQLKTGLRNSRNLIHLDLDPKGEVTGISIPVSIIPTDSGEPGEEDMPMSTF